MWRPQDQKELTAKWVLIQDSPQTFDFSLAPSVTQWERHSFAHSLEALGQQCCRRECWRLRLCLSCKHVRASGPPTLSASSCQTSDSPQELLLGLSPTDLPSVKGVLPGDDVCAVPAHEKLDAVVERVQVLLGYGGLGLLDDVQRIGGAQAQRVDVTEGLEAAVRIHAVHQAVCRDDRACTKHYIAMFNQPCSPIFPSLANFRCRQKPGLFGAQEDPGASDTSGPRLSVS